MADVYTPTYEAAYGVTFPQAPLPLKTDILLGGTWADVTAYVYQRDGASPKIVITRGRTSQSSQVTPSQASVEVNNRDGRWSFANPLSPWYGQVSRNTPLRISVPAQVPYLRLENDSASFAATPSTGALSITGSIDIRVDATLTSHLPGILAAKWTPGTTQASWALQLNGDGTLTLWWSTTGSDTPSGTSTQPVPLGRCAVRATLNAATGLVKFYTAPSMAGPFTQLGATTGPGTATSIFASAAPVAVGDYGSGSGTLPGTPGPVGATTNTGEASPPYASQTAALTGFASGTGRPVQITKVYFSAPAAGPGASGGDNLLAMFPYYNSGPHGAPGYVAGQNAYIDACLALRITPVCCYKPPLAYNATYSGYLQASMSAITAAFAPLGITPLWVFWQEVQDAKNHVSAALWLGTGTPGAGGGNSGYPQYYYDVKHSALTIAGGIWYDCAGHAGPSGWNAYFPGPPNITGLWCDGAGADLYCGTWNNGAITLDALGQLAETNGLPLALFEVGLATSSGSVPGQAEMTAYITYLTGFMVTGIPGDPYSGRLVRGLVNGPVIWYNGLPSGANWNTIAPLNPSGVNAGGYDNGYVVALWQALFDALTGAAGATLASDGINGQVWEFQLYNGIAGTLAADAIFTSLAPGVTSWTDPQGNAWALYGTAEISQRSYRFHGEMSSSPKAQDPSGKDLSVPLQCGGILRRLQQGNAPLASPMRRAILAQSGTLVPEAYWPGEDLAGATSIGSAVGGPAMTFAGSPLIASDSTFACSAPLPVMNNAILHGQVPAYESGGSAIVRFLLNVQAEPAANTRLIRVITTGTAAWWSVYYGTGGALGVAGYDSSGTVFDSGLFAFGVKQNPVWVSMELRPGAGSTVDWSIVVLQPGASTGLGASGTFSGTIGNVTDIYPDAEGGAGQVTMGHWSVQSAWESLFALWGPLAAWTGETAGSRFARLCGENGIGARVYGFPDVSAAMGAQPVDTLPVLLQQCEDADRGMIYEPRQAYGLGYRTLASLLGQPPAVTLDWSQFMLAASGWQPPTGDDMLTINDVTATRVTGGSASTNGASYRITLDDGSAMSVSPPQDGGAGDYATSLSLNVEADAQLPDIAGWAVHMGTATGDRYPAIPLDLSRPAVASLYYTLIELNIGDYIQIVNPPAWLTPDQIRQLAAGVTEGLGGFFFQITWNGIDERPYETAILDDPVYGRADTDGSTLDTQIGVTDTQIGVDPVDVTKPAWTTAAADFPFDIGIDGEQVTTNDVNGPPANFLAGDDASFDASFGDWVPSGNSSIGHSTSQKHSGGGSLALTSIASGNMTAGSFPQASITTLGLPVSPADQIAAATWFLAATTGEAVQVGAAFYDSSGNFLSVAYAPAGADVTTGWTKVTGTVTAPASAAYARLAVQVTAAGGGEVHYVDDCYIADVTAGGATQTFVVTRSVNGVAVGHDQGADVRLFYPPVLAIA